MYQRSKVMTLCILATIMIFVGLASTLRSAGKSTKWDIYPAMSRAYIQYVIDYMAENGDTLFFHTGTYDWSDTPLSPKDANTGAILIEDKSLKIKGEEGTLLIGPQSMDLPAPYTQEGVNAFRIVDLGLDNDVVFDQLNFQTFLRGISCAFTNEDPFIPVCELNLRNLAIKNCTFSDIHRDAISIACIGGNVLIQDNDISEVGRLGLFCSWYWSDNHLAWQPENTRIQIVGNKITPVPHSPLYYNGLYLAQTTNVVIRDNQISGRGEASGVQMEYTKNGPIIAGNYLANISTGINIHSESMVSNAVIEENKLEKISNHGIRLEGTQNIVSKNRIEMLEESYSGIWNKGNNNYFGQNTIVGKGRYAFYLFGSLTGEPGVVYNDILHANNVDNFAPIVAHFRFDFLTHDNLLVGSGMDTNTYIDLGFNNRITGATPLPGGIGEELSEAVHLRNAVIH